MADIDIFRSANLLINYFGDEAVDIANQRIASFESIRNKTAVAVWVKIKDAISKIENEQSGEASLH